MNGNIAIFWPMILQAALTLAVYPLLFRARRSAVMAGEVSIKAFGIPSSEPARSAAAARNLSNQFELPVLFYAVCIGLYVTNGANWLAVLLAWIFVALRIAHAVIHLGSNRLKWRVPVFFAGYGAMVVLWVVFALHVAKVSGTLAAI